MSQSGTHKLDLNPRASRFVEASAILDAKRVAAGRAGVPAPAAAGAVVVEVVDMVEEVVEDIRGYRLYSLSLTNPF
jgi:hypothetical protein